jgi:hypothetical protein
MSDDVANAAPVRACALCPPRAQRNRRPRKTLRRCFDALDADDVVGPILCDDRDVVPKYTHQACALWCPEVYFDARVEKLKKLETALKRAKQIACAWCKGRGAAIGCAVEACPRSYHLECAHEAGCSFVQSEFLLACPRHARRLASERADARWQDVGVEDAEALNREEDGRGEGETRDAKGASTSGAAAEGGANGVVVGASGPAAAAAAAGATPILNRIRAAAEISRGRKQRKKNKKRVKLNDDKFMNTHEGAIYRAVMEAGVRLHAEREKSTGAIADDDEAFKLRESRRLEKDKSEIPRVVVGGGLGTSIYSQGWESLAGMEEHVKTLKEMTLLPLTYPEMFESLGAGAARGVLLHGPPGTGKTAAVRALLGAAAKGPRPISFFSRLGADCLGKYSGEAERKLRLLFEEAEKRQPSIIFFDEIDGLAPARRGGGGAGAQDEIHSSVVATLLALMDGLSGRGSVVVVASTNRPDAVDPALRRPGRFDRELFFGLPDADARAKILAVHTRAWTPRPSRETLDAVAERTEGCAGADLRAIANAALMSALMRACPSLLGGDPTRDSLGAELEAKLPPPESAIRALEDARRAAASGHVGAGISLEQFDALATRVRVRWPLEDAHHDATIVGYDRNTVSHRLQYDDSNLFAGEEAWMQLFRPNVDVVVLSNDVDAIEGTTKTRERALEALTSARALASKHRESRAEGVSVSSRDWTRALSTSSSACSARSAAAALVPRGKSLEHFLCPMLDRVVRDAVVECVKRGAPTTSKCLAAVEMARAASDAAALERALVDAGAVAASRGMSDASAPNALEASDDGDDGDDADDDVAAEEKDKLVPSDDRGGCRLLLSGRPDDGQRETMDVILHALSGTSSHLINLPTLISHGDGDAARGVGPALLEPLRQASKTKTTLVMPDLESWALASYAEADGEVVGVTTSALWDLVQSTVADCYVPTNAGEGGLYVVGSVNAPRDAVPGAIRHFFECAGVAMDVEPRLDDASVFACVDRAAREIASVDVPAAYDDAKRRITAKSASASAARAASVAASATSEVDTNEAACEALRVRVRRSRAIVRAAIAKCTKELFKTRRFDRFFDRSEQAGRLARLALDRKIGDPHKFIRDLRSCAKALKPRQNTHSNFHKPVASLGFSAVDTLESWLHLGVSKLYDEYAARDAEYDEALAASAKAIASAPDARPSSSTPIVDDGQETAQTPARVRDAAAAPPRLRFDDVFEAARDALRARVGDASSRTLEDIRRAIDDVRIQFIADERARALAGVVR